MDKAADFLAAKVTEVGIERFVDAEELGRFLRRIHFAAEHGVTGIPEDAVARATRQLADGLASFAELRNAARDGAVFAVLEALLPMRLINEVAPTHVQLPTGRRARIEYHDGQPPSVASRLQDFFGMRETPTVARGAVPLVVQLLAPNHRPVQVTTDLVSFWKNLYPQVRRELSRRYPRHAWPESPGIQ
jgi:ATP-dependent helicase HrpB